jgi:hypothetical protein
MHDIKPATARLMPKFLAELKNRGFKIVHVVPAGKKLGHQVTGVR